MEEKTYAVNTSINFNYNGKIIEGYLDNKKFNGVLFLMREPNTGGKEADFFWFQKVVDDTDLEYYKELCAKKPSDPDEAKKIKNAKIAYNKYKNCFEFCLKQIENDKKKLKHSAYMNLCPRFGYSSINETYKTALANFTCDSDRWKLIKQIAPDYIITCKDIANKISSFNKCEVNESSNKYGLWFSIDGIKVVGMRHPCRYGKNKLENLFKDVLK